MATQPRLDELLELRHQAHALGVASHHLVNSAFAGLYASVFRGQGLDFEEVREYRPGDDIRNMDWKVTARTNQPHLKVYREERQRSVMLCVDRGPHMDFGTRGVFKSVQAARAAALLGWAASRQHDRVGGVLFGDATCAIEHFRPTKGRRGLWRLLRAITEPRESNQGTDCLGQVLKRLDHGTETGTLIFVIGDFSGDDLSVLEEGLGLLRQRHTLVVIPVDDPADRELPAMGRVMFRQPDGGMVEIDTDDEAGRQAYAETWRRRRANLKRLTDRMGVALVPIATDQDVHFSLRQGLARFSHSRRG